MPRSVNAVASRARRKKILKHAKGYWGRKKNVWTVAKNQIEKGWTYAYRDRKAKKREYRKLWIQRINAAVREHGLNYSTFMGMMSKANIQLDRKVLAHLAMHNPDAFTTVVNTARNASSAAPKATQKVAPKPQAPKTVSPKTETEQVMSATVVTPTPKKDDLKLIEGIGPKVEELMHNKGIYTFSELAGMSVEAIQSILTEAGSRFAILNPETWAEQAALAAAGRMDELKTLQDELDGGRRKA